MPGYRRATPSVAFPGACPNCDHDIASHRAEINPLLCPTETNDRADPSPGNFGPPASSQKTPAEPWPPAGGTLHSYQQLHDHPRRHRHWYPRKVSGMIMKLLKIGRAHV